MPSRSSHTEKPAKATSSKASPFSGSSAPFFQAKPDAGQQTNKPVDQAGLQLQGKESTGQEFFNPSISGNLPGFVQLQALSPFSIRRMEASPVEEETGKLQRAHETSDPSVIPSDSEAENMLQRQPTEEEEGVQRMEAEDAPPEVQLQTEPDIEEESLLQTESNESEVQRRPTSEAAAGPSTDTGASASPADAALDTGIAPTAAPLAPVLVVQPSLKVGAPGDKYEREADEMAEKVQRMPMKQWAFADSRLDGPSVQRFEDESPELQGKIVQLAPALQRSTDGGLSTTPDFASRMRSSGPGTPLPPSTRQHMEGAFGADFSTVRIHTGSEAAQLSSDIGARAFTHQNDIYFNSGQYNPGSQSGQFLLAHELTHTVQQGAAVRRQPEASAETPQVQAGFLDSIGSFLGDMRDRVVRFIRNLPGYFLISVIIGSDPITGQTVERTGMNFIRGFLLLLPGGEAKYNQLRDEGALQNAAAWMDRQIAAIAGLRSRFSRAYDQSRESLSVGDLLDPGEAFDRITGYFAPVVRDAIAYAQRLVVEVLTILKDALLNSLVSFVRERTRAYPLLQVLLGRDPITGEDVPQSMENIIRGFLMLTEAGEAYYNKMVETGALARATAWMREQIRELPTADEVINAFTRAWESFSFEDLLHPVQAFQRIYNILADPVGRIVRFVVNVAAEVLRLIKDALLSLLRRHAHEIRGYRLMTVLLNRDPVTGERVERNATNILSGFVELVAGPEQFRQIEESGAIARMVSWLEELVIRTGISFQMVVNLMMGIWNSVTIQDLVNPIDTFNRIVAKFRDPINRVLEFIIEVVKKVIEIVLQLMNVPVDVIMQIIERASAAFDLIQRDPIGFLMNLLRAVKQGFQQFFTNILTHLLNGLTGWLFGELEAAGVRPPTELSFRAILTFVLDVLGITMERIWEKLAEHPRIGPERVARIRSIIDRLTGIWSIIQEVMNEGIGALWRHVEEYLSNLWNMVLEQVRTWVMERIVNQVVTRLMSMLDPTGIMAVIRSVEALYRTIQSFIQRLNEILRIVNSFVGGILEIAQGNLTPAANYLERTMAGAIPTMIGFLANYIGLSGIGERIGQMIEHLREVVDQALTRLIHRVVDMGFSLLDRAMGRGGEASDPLSVVKQDIHREETAYLTNGAITYEEAQIVAHNVARRNNATVSSISIIDGGTKWNYNIVQRAEEEGPVKEEALCDEPGDSASGIGNIARHGSRRGGSSLRSGPPIHWLESEHILPFATGRNLWQALSLFLPERGWPEDNRQTTIMIYYGAARIKTPPDNSLSAQFTRIVSDSGIAEAFNTRIVAFEEGNESAMSQASELLHELLGALEAAKDNAVERTNVAITQEHAQVAEGCTKTNGQRRGEDTPKPEPTNVENAANQQYRDIMDLVTNELNRRIDRRNRNRR